MEIKKEEIKGALDSANEALEALRQPKRAETAIGMNGAFCILEKLLCACGKNESVMVQKSER